jgi:hypothetical protein
MSEKSSAVADSRSEVSEKPSAAADSYSEASEASSAVADGNLKKKIPKIIYIRETKLFYSFI